MRFSDLTPGYEFPSTALALDATTVARYLAATEDDNALYRQDGALRLVPPLAVAALAFRGIAQELALEPGSLHTGQELAFRRPVAVGERLTALARVTTSSKRRGFTVLVIDVAATDEEGETPLSGRMTLMVAGADQNAPPNGPRLVAGEQIVDVYGQELAQALAEKVLGRGEAAPEAGGERAAPEGETPPKEYRPLPAQEIVPGLALGPLVRVATQERIDRYAEASGDYNPIHVDRAFAAASPFGGTVAHGMLLLAYMSALLTRTFGMAWLEAGVLKVKFRNPAPAGATVAALGRVERLEQDHGVQYAMCALRLENAEGEALITGDARVEVGA